ncbi:MAG: eukaryotic-like serine/threonine-protein kinase [Verrucomicrobiota bacterium]|jgi:serine/threonine-protein kinase
MSDRARRVAEIVKSALERTREERITFLDQACAADSETRAEVDSFLQFEDEASYFIEQGALHVAAETIARDPATPFPQQIDGYQILSRIGVGGMGEVYLAHDTKLRRKVALKLVRAGMDSAEIVTRFRHEEQILASLNHPNIAQLYGAGVAAGDIPFFAMEHVAGTRIDEYCNAHALSTAARLELFRKVCAAVHYAHQRLVIHRDLKPSNILVTADGEPKLLDFGIAKLVESPDAFTQMQTLPGAMTPDYASPEQIRGDAVTTSSDIYSLGVLLYELLTGQRPYRLKTRSADEIARAITEQEPERPSTAIARGDGNSKFEIRNSKFPPGDLDNIVLMALRKESKRRYESAAAFSADIGRYLEGRPVSARKDTVTYRTTRFVQRNRLGVVAAVIVFLSLLGGIIATGWQARRATEQAKVAAQERDRARVEAAKAERINEFLQNVLGFSVVSWVSSNPKRKNVATIAEALDEASQRSDSELADQPEVLAAVKFSIAASYFGQGKPDRAEQLFRASLDLRRRVLGSEHQDTAISMTLLAEVLVHQGKFAEAETLSREAIAIFRRERARGNLAPKWFPLAHSLLGMALISSGDAEGGETALRQGIEASADLTGVLRSLVASLYGNLSVARGNQGDIDGAIAWLQKSIEEHRRVPGEPSIEMGIALGNLASFLIIKGEYGAAEPALQESLKIYVNAVGEKHQFTTWSIIYLADSYYLQGDYLRARAEIDRAIGIQQEVLQEGHIDFARSWTVLGKILTRTSDAKAAETYLRRALDLRARALKPGHWRVAETQGALGECLMSQNRYEEAESILLESHAGLSKALGANDPRTRDARQRLLALYEAWGKPESANGYR